MKTIQDLRDKARYARENVEECRYFGEHDRANRLLKIARRLETQAAKLERVRRAAAKTRLQGAMRRLRAA